MKISEKIINIRNKNNLTQEGLAEVLGVSRQTVSNWENNKCYPDITTLILISEKFNVSFDNMIKEDREMVENLDKKINSNKYKKIFDYNNELFLKLINKNNDKLDFITFDSNFYNGINQIKEFSFNKIKCKDDFNTRFN